MKGRENYLILKKIAESLEIQRVYSNMKKLNSDALTANQPIASATMTEASPRKIIQNRATSSSSFIFKDKIPVPNMTKIDNKNITSIDRYMNFDLKNFKISD